jgi:hypothetical protein
MVGAVNAVDSQNLLALSALNLTQLSAMATLPTGSAGAVIPGQPPGNVGTDLYIPSAPPAALAATYNRFGLPDGTSADSAATLAGALIHMLRQRTFVSALALDQATNAYRLVDAQGSPAP